MNSSDTLLDRLRGGDPAARDELFLFLWSDLRGLARRIMRQQGPDHTLQPTALLHEAWARLSQGKRGGWNDKAHFLRSAASTMRTVMVDYARRKQATKRPPAERRVDLQPVLQLYESRCNGDVIALDEALDKLPSRHRELVDLRFFGGYDMAECARILGISIRQAGRDWKIAKTILHDCLSSD